MQNSEKNTFQHESLQQYLKELTELSIKHGLGLDEDGFLYHMDLELDDYERKFKADPEGRLSFL